MQGWSWTELSVLVLYFAVLQLHRVAGCFANRLGSKFLLQKAQEKDVSN